MPKTVMMTYFSKMRIFYYEVGGLEFFDENGCKQFKNKIKRDTKEELDNDCKNFLSFNVDHSLMVISAIENENFLFEINEKRFRFRKNLISDLKSKKTKSSDKGLNWSEYLLSLKYSWQ